MEMNQQDRPANDQQDEQTATPTAQILERVALIEQLRREGANTAEIAKRLGIVISTYWQFAYNLKKRFPDLYERVKSPRSYKRSAPSGNQKMGIDRSFRELPITLPECLEIAFLRVPVPMSEADYIVILGAVKAWKHALTSELHDPKREADGDDQDGDDQDV